MALALDYAFAHGALPVAAAGNDGTTTPSYPAAYDHVLSVAATDADDEIAGFSNRGASWVDVSAPGVGIVSTLPTYDNATGVVRYGYLSGHVDGDTDRGRNRGVDLGPFPGGRSEPRRRGADRSQRPTDPRDRDLLALRTGGRLPSRHRERATVLGGAGRADVPSGADGATPIGARPAGAGRAAGDGSRHSRRIQGLARTSRWTPSPVRRRPRRRPDWRPGGGNAPVPEGAGTQDQGRRLELGQLREDQAERGVRVPVTPARDQRARPAAQGHGKFQRGRTPCARDAPPDRHDLRRRPLRHPPDRLDRAFRHSRPHNSPTSRPGRDSIRLLTTCGP